MKIALLLVLVGMAGCGEDQSDPSSDRATETNNATNAATNNSVTNNTTNNSTNANNATNNSTSTNGSTNNSTTGTNNGTTAPLPHSLHVELTWDTPGDFDQTDTVGADMDLHLAHPEGSLGTDQEDLDMDGIPEPWGSIRYDCYGRNASPDWGFLFDPIDDPVHDKDDINGQGPENIRLEQMEPVIYRVGAAYYSAATFGESTATVRVFVDDELKYAASITLPDQGYLWEVAWVDGRTGEVVSRDTPNGPLLFSPIP